MNNEQPPDDEELLASATPVARDWDVEKLWSRVRAETIDAGTAQPPRPIRHFHVPSRPKRRRWPMIVGGGAVAAAALVAAIALYSRNNSLHSAGDTARPSEYLTGIGERATIRLVDGSSVVLAPRSRLEISPNYGTGSRELTLGGEATFDVKHDARAPFRVRAGSAVVEDIGTRFNVQAYGNGIVDVAVGEGEVALFSSANADTVLLAQGDIGVVDSSGKARSYRPASIASRFAWAEGRLVFDNERLGDALESLVRWYDLEITADGAELRSKRITAEFAIERPTEMIEALASAVHAKVERAGRRVTLRRLP